MPNAFVHLSRGGNAIIAVPGGTTTRGASPLFMELANNFGKSNGSGIQEMTVPRDTSNWGRSCSLSQLACPFKKVGMSSAHAAIVPPINKQATERFSLSRREAHRRTAILLSTPSDGVKFANLRCRRNASL